MPWRKCKKNNNIDIATQGCKREVLTPAKIIGSHSLTWYFLMVSSVLILLPFTCFLLSGTPAPTQVLTRPNWPFLALDLRTQEPRAPAPYAFHLPYFSLPPFPNPRAPKSGATSNHPTNLHPSPTSFSAQSPRCAQGRGGPGACCRGPRNLGAAPTGRGTWGGLGPGSREEFFSNVPIDGNRWPRLRGGGVWEEGLRGPRAGPAAPPLPHWLSWAWSELFNTVSFRHRM